MMSNKNIRAVIFVFLLCYFVNLGDGARILGIFPMPAPSHYILGSSLMRGLAEKGHDVTVVSPFGEKDPPKNGTYRDIILTGLVEEMQERFAKDVNMFDREGSSPVLGAIFVTTIISEFAEMSFAHENFKKLIDSDEEFDVVIVEQFLNDAQKALATHFRAPLILFSTVGPNTWINHLVGNPSPPSYIADMNLAYPPKMTFFQRLANSGMTLFNSLLFNLYTYPQQNAVIKKYMPNGPDLSEVVHNASLVLLNSHPTLNQPVPLVPCMVEIGGFHVKPPKKLPEDLQTFLDNAKEGVIYFSMGSNLKSAQLPLEKRQALLNAFSKLKQKVLWKWEEDVLPGQPKNVKLSKWLPQQDILAHPNIKLFITHGGLLSTTETVYHGVPVLAIPIFGDQQMNALNAVNNGIGLTLPYREITEEKLTEKINELLNNPKYTNNVKTRSRLFHDRQVSPMDTAVYWVEYVVRHRGAPHLRVAGLDLPWYKYHLLDVLAFVAIIYLILLVIIFKIGKRLVCKFCCKNKSTKSKVKKN